MKTRLMWIVLIVICNTMILFGLLTTFSSDIINQTMGNVFTILGLNSFLFLLSIKHSQFVEKHKVQLILGGIIGFATAIIIYGILAYNEVNNLTINTVLSIIFCVLTTCILVPFSKELEKEL